MPIFELVYTVFELVPANADTVAITVSLVMLFISLVSLPLEVVVVIESPVLKVFVNCVPTPVTAVPDTLTVQGLYTVACTSREPVGAFVPTPVHPSQVIPKVGVDAAFCTSITESVSAPAPFLNVRAPLVELVTTSGLGVELL